MRARSIFFWLLPGRSNDSTPCSQERVLVAPVPALLRALPESFSLCCPQGQASQGGKEGVCPQPSLQQ